MSRETVRDYEKIRGTINFLRYCLDDCPIALGNKQIQRDENDRPYLACGKCEGRYTLDRLPIHCDYAELYVCRECYPEHCLLEKKMIEEGRLVGRCSIPELKKAKKGMIKWIK